MCYKKLFLHFSLYIFSKKIKYWTGWFFIPAGHRVGWISTEMFCSVTNLSLKDPDFSRKSEGKYSLVVYSFLDGFMGFKWTINNVSIHFNLHHLKVNLLISVRNSPSESALFHVSLMSFSVLCLIGRPLLSTGHPPQWSPDAGGNPQVPAGR